MAVGTFSLALPAVAAAAGVYFFGHQQTKTKHVESRIEGPVKSNLALEEKQEKKKADLPRFAVELDGLHCFETMVAHLSNPSC